MRTATKLSPLSHLSNSHWVARSPLYFILLSAGFVLYADKFFAGVMYNVIGWLDPYMYVAYGLKYTYAGFWDNYYKISRLPWVMTEFAFRRVFDPTVVTLFLQAFCFSLMAVSIYLAFGTIFNRRAGLFCAAVAIFAPFFHSNGGADYHNTLGGPLYFLTFALAVLAIDRSSTWLAILSGAVAAATIHTNPLFIWSALALVLPAVAYWRQREGRLSKLLVLIAAFIVGGLTLTVALALTNYSVGRQLLFFIPQINFMLELGGGNRWWSPMTWEVMRGSRQSGFLLAIFIISIVEIAMITTRSSWRREGIRAAAYAGYCITLVLATILDASGQTILKPDYMSYQVAAAAIVAFAAVVDKCTAEQERWFDGAVILLLVPVLCALCLSVAGSSGIFAGTDLVPPLVVALVAVLGFYAISWGARSVRAGSLALLVWPMVNAALAHPDRYRYDACRVAAHLHGSMSVAAMMSVKLTREPEKVFIWFDRDDKFRSDNPCYQNISFREFAVSSSQVIGGALGGIFPVPPFESVSKEQVERAAQNGSLVVLMFVDPTVPGRFERRTAELGFVAKNIMRYFDKPSGATFEFIELRGVSR